VQTTSPAGAEAAGGDVAARGAAPAAVLGRPAATAFVAPALLLIAGFLVFPALWTLYLGLTDYRLTGAAAANPRVVGLENYAQAVGDPQFRGSLWVTLLFVLGSAVIGQTCLGFALAWKLRDWRSPLRSVVEVLVILAWILPGSVVAFLWIAFLDGESGTLNGLLAGVRTEWLLEVPLLSVIVFNTWRGTAFSMLLYGAALSAVPPSHLETARLAGASGWQQLRDVVLPTIRGHILTSLLLISLWTFNDFTPYLLTRGGPNFRTEVLPIYIFRNAISSGQLGYGAAISTIVLLINLVIALFYLRLLRERR
jgi:multiple sugar transport system permease protein